MYVQNPTLIRLDFPSCGGCYENKITRNNCKEVNKFWVMKFTKLKDVEPNCRKCGCSLIEL